MADGVQSRVAGGGFWSQPQAQYSKQTHDLLKDMMKESKLTNFQQRHLEKTLRGGGSLPSNCPPTHSAQRKKTPVSAPAVSKVLNPRNYKTTIRTKQQMENMGAFEKPDYTPAHNTRGVSKEKEKARLANIMEFGQDIPPRDKRKQRKAPEPAPAVDRFDELQSEIEERQSFLREMEGLGKGAQFRTIISTEVSQLIREMEMIDKKKSAELERLIEAENRKAATERS
ncbi:UPF0193 protein EVG1 homolog [Mizuhopecten yessoensis]|uniref:UPF0193 protein EVG1-like n=1 Tax=Mizuhopecten yessoensis TaxID=6573 RepID=A0A210QWB3_MIZYE|nr:UPF0193 protein EVG1 homolog [Mizuhopecten yessoensis]OWF53004.1 UPF0193 protein EVG1-like [Mizuhopecten yessoensis]